MTAGRFKVLAGQPGVQCPSVWRFGLDMTSFRKVPCVPHRVAARVMLCSSLFLCGLLQSASGVNFFTTTYPAGFGPNSVVAGDFEPRREHGFGRGRCVHRLCLLRPGCGRRCCWAGPRHFPERQKIRGRCSWRSCRRRDRGRLQLGDGALDLAVVNTGINLFGDVSVLLGNGDGSFQPPSAYAVGGAVPVWVTVGFQRRPQLDGASVTTTTRIWDIYSER